jgi:transposase InsO family protein
MTSQHDERMTAIHLLRAGHSVPRVAEQLGRSERWVRKWRQRYEQAGWTGLQERSRAPQQHGRRIPNETRQLVIQARSELEAVAATGPGLKYIGGRAVRTKLQGRLVGSAPSVATIERILRTAGLTQRRQPAAPEIRYPHVRPTTSHQLGQIDIVPHYLTGGQKVACFNGLDVVSRYPTGQAYAQARAQDAVAFCIHFWQTVGIPTYTQVDNQDCFSGGHTHPYVLGQVVRLALTVGTELIFSPVYHPESNGYVERFHQEYDRHVWQDTYLADLPAVQASAEHFFVAYRQSRHHVALAERSPNEVHMQTPPHRLSLTFQMPNGRLPLRAGRVHFIRRLQPDGTISVLNVNWPVPQVDPLQGVWATLELTPTGATLAVYDAAPDVTERTCLVTHPFPLQEPVLPCQSTRIATPAASESTATEAQPIMPPLLPAMTQISATAHLIRAVSLAFLTVLLRPHPRAVTARSIDGS